jgi:hypothetical protein
LEFTALLLAKAHPSVMQHYRKMLTDRTDTSRGSHEREKERDRERQRGTRTPGTDDQACGMDVDGEEGGRNSDCAQTAMEDVEAPVPTAMEDVEAPDPDILL